MSARAIALAAFTATLLPACTGDRGTYPSLAARPIETINLDEPATPVAVATPDPALDAQLAGIERDRAAAAAAFDAVATRAERQARAARSAQVGSARWIDAQTTLAEVDDRRAVHQEVLGRLEDLSAGRLQALLPAYPRLEAALEAGRAAATAQTRRIDAIGALLRAA